MDTIQQLSGSLWTDFNVHDPGVTILEQLCFALTDLSYRTDFDVQDIFYSTTNKDRFFLNPDELFPCSSLTVNDYRKIIVDSISEINNVWVFPLSAQYTSLNGLYKIVIDVKDSVKKEEEKKIVLEKVESIYNLNRTLCEDVEHIVILEHLPIYLYATIELDGKVKCESILAEIYFRLSDFLSPKLYFHSLEEMLKLDYKIENIYSGPLLKNGFIKEDTLDVKMNRIHISDFIKLLMHIEGVVSVKSIHLQVKDVNYYDQIDISEEELPKLVFDFDNLVSTTTITFLSGNVPYETCKNEYVKRSFNELSAVNKKVYRLEKAHVDLPKGENLALEEYYSIQHDFPLVYGIGTFGIAPSASNMRKGQAKQLKGYLMIFEQIMANYLSQLAHIKDLLSLTTEAKKTYFYQSLADYVPDIKPLLNQDNLGALTSLNDNFTERRNRFLDYLLALHGEVYNQDILSRFNYYYTEVEFENYLIKTKTKFLQAIPFSNKNRAKAFNYRAKRISNEDSTGTETKVALLLGIDEQAQHNTLNSIITIYEHYGLKLVDSKTDSELLRLWENELIVYNESLNNGAVNSFDYIDSEDATFNDCTDVTKEQLFKNTLPFRSGIITEEFLREGLILENYKIGKGKETEISDWTLFFSYLNDREWIKIGNYLSEEEAINTAIALIQVLKKISIETERLHRIEHILLRPEKGDCLYGIYLLSTEGKKMLRSKRLYTFEERERAVTELYAEIYNYENYSIEVTIDRDFEVHFNTTNRVHSFISIFPKESVEETHRDMESLFSFMSNQENIISYKNKIAFYIRYSDEESMIPEDFYSFRSTLILPNWTSRFKNKEFRVLVEKIVNENCPAHIFQKIVWLNPNEMYDYEEAYYSWLEEKRFFFPDKKKMNSCSNRLIQLLQKYNNSNE